MENEIKRLKEIIIEQAEIITDMRKAIKEMANPRKNKEDFEKLMKED